MMRRCGKDQVCSQRADVEHRDPEDHRGGFDAVVVGLCLAGAAWTVVCAKASSGSSPLGAGLFLAVGVSYSLARAASIRARWIVPSLLAGGIVVTAWLFRSDLPSAGPLVGPLHYTNASAALYLQGTIAAMLLQVVAPKRWLRISGLVAAVVLGGATLLTNSMAADALLVLAVIVGSCRTQRWSRVAIASVGCLLVVALSTSVSLGLLYRPCSDDSAVQRIVGQTLSQRRPALWHDALELMERYPLTGVGPGRFQYASPVARSDRDARWAHNGFLQQGAETGFLGLVIIVAIFGWAFVKLWTAPRHDGAPALGSAALGALGIQACIDYVFHFPVLPIVAAALVGVAVTPGPVSRSALADERDVEQANA